MRDTLQLDPDTWDLTVDGFGNIATASAPYATAQDVASACRLWQGEAIFDIRRGLPYEQEILGQQVPGNVLSGWIEAEARTNPDVADVQVVLTQEGNRVLGGQIQFTTTDGTTSVLAL